MKKICILTSLVGCLVLIHTCFAYSTSVQGVYRRYIPLKSGLKFNGLHESKCQCVDYDCGCCIHVQSTFFKLNDTGCLNMTYLPDQYGLSITFSIDKKVLINETISAKNPPPICADIPGLKELAKMCLVFYDLDISGRELSGCAKLQLQLIYVIKESFNLGCFKFNAYQKQVYKPQKQWHQIETIEVEK